MAAIKIPKLPGNKSSDSEQIKSINNYLARLSETLEYAFNNLDKDNFNNNSDLSKISNYATNETIEKLRADMETMAKRIKALEDAN